MERGIFAAVLIGLGIAVQVAVLGRTAAGTNPLATSLALQIGGVSVGVIWASSTGAWSEVLSLARSWWLIPLGVGGWIVVAALGYSSSRIGVGSTLALSVAAQLLAALAIDFVGATQRPNIRSLIGGGLVLLGAALLGATK